MKKLIFLFLCFQASLSFSQQKFTINGYVRDATNGETLIGATVYIGSIEIGVITNEYGFYAITVPPGAYTLQVSYVGYESKSVSV
ncbi:MAG: carboxypeptidase-like regulatory domain-containing protein, partial [Cyclobacteriaceae bacterium]